VYLQHQSGQVADRSTTTGRAPEEVPLLADVVALDGCAIAGATGSEVESGMGSLGMACGLGVALGDASSNCCSVQLSEVSICCSWRSVSMRSTSSAFLALASWNSCA